MRRSDFYLGDFNLGLARFLGQRLSWADDGPSRSHSNAVSVSCLLTNHEGCRLTTQHPTEISAVPSERYSPTTIDPVDLSGAWPVFY